jgi:large repetitive protein
MPSTGRLFAAGAAALLFASRVAAQSAPSLGSAASFVVLGGSNVTSSGPTVATGNVGVAPGGTIIGLGPKSFIAGTTISNAKEAQRDNAAAYASLANRTCIAITAGNYGLTAGVYCASTLPKTLTLDGRGNADSVWIFIVADTLVTMEDAAILMINGGRDDHVFWQVGSSATLGRNSTFLGNILARSNITFGAGARLSGRALAQTGFVTLNGNQVSLCCTPLTFSPTTLPNGTENGEYDQTITAGGTVGPYILTQPTGSLPLGLTFANGRISGKPTENGTFSFTVMAIDAHGCPSAQTYTLAVAACPIALATLPDGIVGVLYPPTMIPSGGTAPYSCTVSPGALPPGLVLNGCVVSGTPITPGPFGFTLTATDAQKQSCSRSYVVTMAPPPLCAITISPTMLPGGTVGVQYLQKLTATCGAIFTSQTLPNGLVLMSDGTISGFPNAVGPTTVTVTATAAASTPASSTYTIQIDCPVILSAATLANGIVGQRYDATITALGGTAPFSFTYTGTLPPGLSVPPAINGIPQHSGHYVFTVTATNSEGCIGIQTYGIDIVCPSMSISPSTLPTLSVGKSVNVPFTPASSTFTVTTGSLPQGLTFCLANVLCGVPKAATDYAFTLTASDVAGCSTSQDFHGTVSCDPSTFGISPPSSNLPGGTVGIFYSTMFTPTGGVSPYTFTAFGPTYLPPGLSLTGATLSGIPTAPGRFNFGVAVTDKTGIMSCPQIYTIVVGPAALPSPTVPVFSAWALFMTIVLLAGIGFITLRK